MIERRRRLVITIITMLIVCASAVYGSVKHQDTTSPTSEEAVIHSKPGSALEALGTIDIKGRAPKTDYSRDQFGAGWADVDTCDMRNYILQRDMQKVQLSADNCTVLSGTLQDPYTAKTITFQRGATTSQAVQIDHVVALSDAWQKGAQQLDISVRAEFANDPLNLLAVDGPSNNKKRDGDAATWLPPSKEYRCRYVARQIAVKQKYHLWMTNAEHNAVTNILRACPDQSLIIE